LSYCVSAVFLKSGIIYIYDTFLFRAMNTTLEVGPQGRIVIPATIRKAMGIEVGAKLVARVEDGRLVLETQDQLLNQFYSRFAQARLQPGESIVDELIAEHRGESARE